ncbi:hypothetical protein, variant 2 [Cryptococcus amylolentus CBS 6039]|nr:hypothetical protein, variant 1 [Cryptococcus amylolentus CBS 6039]XP_018989283.1 hypothetical protein, variant 2 [Cryptococcus amylolentus CBS 6039]ODN73370.1 hypothetical protein, variant 1 [Cryptococcus amylolentus CBS 6039]ODN73371.1 hypothetical protein, variant 2 [Cryptococcus amylolentus CBS 6039]
MSSTHSSPLMKERKRSAHWSGQDTQILINVLLREKDTRTADNGFPPEVWQEVSGLLMGSNPNLAQDGSEMLLGGAKTPEACKSRWQRLQRDYKAAKELAQLPDIKWNNTTHRLEATEHAWQNAAKVYEITNKHRKIHLPWWDSLVILCSREATRSRGRRRRKKSIEADQEEYQAELLAESSRHAAQVHAQMTNGHGHHGYEPMSNGHHPHHHHPQEHHQQHHHGMHDPNQGGSGLVGLSNGALQAVEHGAFSWEAGSSGDGDFDQSFLPNQAFIPQKRNPMFDPGLLTPETSSGTTVSAPLTLHDTPNKRQRTSSRTSQTHVLPHQHLGNMPGANYPYAPMASGNQTAAGPGAQSPDYGSGEGMLDPVLLQATASPGITLKTYTPPEKGGPATTMQGSLGNPQVHRRAPSQSQPQPRHPPTSHSSSDSSSTHNTHNNLQIQAQAHNHPQSHPHFQAQSQPQSVHQPHLTQIQPPLQVSPSDPMFLSSLTESQRRTEALLQLQTVDADMRDEEMVEVMEEFEMNVAAADTYLAIKKEALRKMWLANLVKRRQR